MNFSDNLPTIACGMSPFVSRLTRRLHSGDCKIALGLLREGARRLFQAQGFALIAVIVVTGKAATGAGLQIY